MKFSVFGRREQSIPISPLSLLISTPFIPGQLEHAERVGIIGNDPINTNSYCSLPRYGCHCFSSLLYAREYGGLR